MAYKWQTDVLERIRVLAEDLYKNPEKYVPEKEYMTDFTITLYIAVDGQITEVVPPIEVRSRYYPDTLYGQVKHVKEEET